MSQPLITSGNEVIQAVIMVNAFNVFILVAGLGLLGFLLVRKQRVFALVWLLILSVLMAGLTTPVFSTSKAERSRIDCTNGRVIAEKAIEHWAKEKGIAQGAEVDVQAVAIYLKAGILPKCQQGGDYLVGKVGQRVSCIVPDHNKN